MKSESIRTPGTQNGKHARQTSLTIVGIGASAGGLDSFERLLKHLPANTGRAFVFVQHLDPAHESRLTEILSHTTKMPVVDAKEGMRVEPNSVYVIPPNTNMRIMRQALHLEPRSQSDGRYAPIDFFFRSLAEERGEQAIGVILSGTASDGTLGLKAIKEGGGITFAQDAASAKYFGMPGSAIAAGAVDFILPPEDIASRLARLRDHAYVRLPRAQSAPHANNKKESPIGQLFSLMKKSFGVDFSVYKFSTINRRISRRMALGAIDDIEDYVSRVEKDPGQLRALFQDMFIGVTEFFRYPGAFKALAKTVYPAILRKRPPDSPIRIWVPGCSTGEEVYSIAISLLEYMDHRAHVSPIQIFGTDVNDEAIKKARLGRYGRQIEATVSKARLRRFFTKVDGDYQIIKMVRDLCVFAKHDVLTNPPFTRLDVLSCSNLLIYLNPDSQRKLLPMFHYALKPNGFLILGPEETVGAAGELFSLKDRTYKLYTVKAAPRLYFEPSMEGEPHIPAMHTVKKSPAVASQFDRYKEAADQLILNHYGPPAVLLDENLEILHLRGHTGPYLELSPGIVSLNVLKMAREGLLDGLRTALETARKKDAAVTKEGLHVESDGQERLVDLHVVPVRMPGSAERTFLVLFEDTTHSEKASEKVASKRGRQFTRTTASADLRVAQLKQELAATKAYLQSAIEGKESSNEELRSLNEELMSSNEELQSTSEELETTNEELQSANEELSTLNDTLKSRSQELDQANDDILNTFASLDISALILDKHLHIRRCTPMAQKMLKLTSDDLGRRLPAARLPFSLPDLQHHVRQSMEHLEPWYSNMHDEKGRLHILQVRPYVRTNGQVGGAVIAFTDISKGEEGFQAMANSMPEPVAFVDADERYVFANTACEKWYGVSPRKAEGLPIREVYGEEIYGAVRPMIEKVLKGNPVDYDGYLAFPKAGRRYVHITYIPRKDPAGKILGFYTVSRDLTRLKEADERFRVFVENAPVAIVIHEPSGKIVVTNSEAERMFGYSHGEMVRQPVEMLLPKGLRHKHIKERNAYVKKPRVRPMGIGRELRARRKDGSEFPVEISLSPLPTLAGNFVSATIFDLTDRKRLAEQARLATVLNERTTVARDLHDTLAQGFTGIIMNLEAAQEAGLSAEEAKIRLKKAEEVARENLEEVRRTLVELSGPFTRKVENLTRSLRRLADDSQSSNQKPVVKFLSRGAPRPLGHVIGENLLFIAQQATDNSLRHADAKLVHIHLSFSGNEVRLRVQDNGRGFDVRRAKQGIGLASMRDRAEYIGGRFTLKSHHGKGTDVEVRVPLPRNRLPEAPQ